MRTPLRNFRADDETWARWQAVAADLEIPVAAMIHDGVERLISSVRPGMVAPPRTPRVHAPPRIERTIPCVHHVPPSSHCSRGCDG